MIIEAFINGLLFGGVCALVALGLNLLFGVVRIVNLAHGEIIMLGMYGVFWIYSWSKNMFLAGLVTVSSLIPFMVLIQKAVFNKLLKAPGINQLIATGGMILALSYGAEIVWGVDYRSIPLTFPIAQIHGVFISISRLIAFAIAMSCALLLYLFLYKTYPGMAIRAMVQDSEEAELLGIKPEKMYVLAVGITGLLAGIAAICLTLIYSIHPHVGGEFTLFAFLIVVLGGLGSLSGSVVGAFIISEVFTISSILVGLEWAYVITLIFFILILILKPYGLMGRGE